MSAYRHAELRTYVRTWTKTSPAGWPDPGSDPHPVRTPDTIFPAADWPALIKPMADVRDVAFEGEEHGVATEAAAPDLEIERFLGLLMSGGPGAA